MAEGIRIHHPTLSSCTLLVPHPGKVENGKQVYRAKDIWVRLDENGDCLVSEGVWEQLLEAKTEGFSPHEFIIVNTVTDPPAQTVGDVSPESERRMYRQVNEALQEIAPPGIKPRVVRGGGRKQQG